MQQLQREMDTDWRESDYSVGPRTQAAEAQYIYP
jgi:hypothetical protein